MTPPALPPTPQLSLRLRTLATQLAYVRAISTLEPHVARALALAGEELDELVAEAELCEALLLETPPPTVEELEVALERARAGRG